MALRPTFGKRASQGKKLTLKNFKLPAVSGGGDDDTERVWQTLQDAIAAIHEEKPISTTLQTLSKNVQSQCTLKLAAKLYAKLSKALEKHLKVTAAVFHQAEFSSSLARLKRVTQIWSQHCNHTILIRSIFIDLDRTYVIDTPNIEPIWELGLRLFRKNMFNTDANLQNVIEALIDCFNAERDGNAIESTLIRDTSQMFKAIGVYHHVFEPRFLAATTEYYTGEASKCSEEFDVPAYLAHCQRRLEEERERRQMALDISTERELIAGVQKTLIYDKTPYLLGPGFEKMMSELLLEDLALLYHLLSLVCALEQLKTAFSQYIKNHGQIFVSNPERDETMIEDLLKFKASIDTVVQKSFNKNTMMFQAQKMAFESFINRRTNKPAEMVAKFIDSKMRTGFKECTEDELDRLLDSVLVIFRYINGKDVFEAFYKTHLARRLLYNKSASVDLERSMLTKLKQECGAAFTSNLEGMFKDLHISEELNSSYREHLTSRGTELPLDLSVHVLTQSYWPSYTIIDIAMPSIMSTEQERFRDYYCNLHQSRRLHWLNLQGHCVMAADFPRGKKDLHVSTVQAVVLMLFNSHRVLTLEEIETFTKIPKDELNRTMLSLSCGKTRVLAKHPKSVESNDKFAVNEKFSNQHKRIKINQIQLKETVKENEATNEKVFQDRVFAVDAAIVRIMKTRKQLKHNLLMSDVLEQLQFPVKPSDVKKRIESLIERDYLERDETDSSLYKYLA